MKKALIILSLIAVSGGMAFALDNVISDRDSTGGLQFDYAKDETKLIDVDSMKKADKAKAAMEEDSQKARKAPKIRYNREELTRQRALDFSTQQVNSMTQPFVGRQF